MLNINNRYYKRSMQQNGKNISNFPRLLHRLETSCHVTEAMHNKEAGFTLIEVIVTMLIAGILATIAGLGIVQGVKGYVFASKNAAMTQKAELALARMSLELRDIKYIPDDPDASGAKKITYKYVKDFVNDEIVSHSIKFVSGDIILVVDGNDRVLVDNVVLINDKLFSYLKSDGTEWSPSSDSATSLAVIQIKFILSHTDPDISDSITFETIINPRNTF